MALREVLRLLLLGWLWLEAAWRALRRWLWIGPRPLVSAENAAARTLQAMDGRPLLHLGAVLRNGTLTADEVQGAAHLCAWAAAGSCATITLYQQRGSLVPEAGKALVRELRALSDAGCLAARGVRVTMRVQGQWQGHGLTAEAEAKDEAPTTLVQLLSQAEAGDDLVLGAARSLARDVAQGHLTPEQITPALLSSQLCLQSHDDPQLVLCFDGPTRNGFLPWHIRTTEFFECCELRDLRFADFVAVLERFAQVEQRYGA